MSAPALRFEDDAGRAFPDWEMKKLGDLGKVSMCKRVLKAQTSLNGDVPFYKIGTFGKQADAFIAQELYEKFSDLYPFPKTGDILISAAGTIGRTVVYDGKPSYFQDSNIVWIDNDESFVINKFLNFCYETIEWTTENTTIARLYNDNLKSVHVKFPSLPEQTKIANFLTAVDEKLTQLTRKHDLLTQYKKGVMQQIFSQQLRFKDDNGCDFPEWKECTIGEIATQKSKKLSPENANVDLRCIELEHISQTTGQLLGYVDASKQKSLKSQFSEGDVLFGKLRPYLRKYLKAPFDGVCSTEIWVLRGRKVSNDYLFYFVQAERFLTVANISSGSKMPRADWDVVASDEVEIPCTTEQTKIANFLTAIDEKITATKAQLEAVKQYKQGLLQQMFV